MAEGYVYCFTNESMPGLVKIGMTTRTPEERLHEANNNGVPTYRPPTPYVIELAKRVNDPSRREQIIHKYFDHERVNPRREFFRVSMERIKPLFDLMDEIDSEPRNEDRDDQIKEKSSRRSLSRCLENGQKIRHKTHNNASGHGVFDSDLNAIVYRGDTYKTLNRFATDYYNNVVFKWEQKSKIKNGWKVCEYESDGLWYPTDGLKLTN